MQIIQEYGKGGMVSFYIIMLDIAHVSHSISVILTIKAWRQFLLLLGGSHEHKNAYER